MSTGRNELCPCGSGKKYKKCCADKVTTLTYTKEEILVVQLQMFEYVTDHYFMELRDYLALIAGDKASNSLSSDDYRTLSIMAAAHWVFDKRNQEENGLIDEIISLPFWKVKQRRLLEAWQETSLFSLYLIEEWGEKELLVKDMMSGEKLHVETPPDFANGPRGICFLSLVPVQHLWFMFGMPYFISPYGENVNSEAFDGVQKSLEGLINLAKSVSFEDPFFAFMEKYFSLFRVDEAKTEEFNVDADLTPEENQVMTVFTKHASQELQEAGGIEEAEKIWKSYCNVAVPIIKKPAAYAATLEYFISNDVLSISGATQKALGKKYGVSPNTISKRVQDFDNALMEYEIRTDVLGPPDPHPEESRLVMERHLFILHKEMQRLGLSSAEEIQAFQQEFDPEKARTDHWPEGDRVQLMLYDAMLAPDLSEKNRLIQKALKLDENQPDIYRQLAALTESEEEALEWSRKAVEAGRSSLGKEVFEEEKGHFWSILETRPFMRALQQYASLLEVYDSKQAEELYEEMLELNPIDNQAIRYQLLSLYIMHSEYGKADALIDKYPEETTFWLFHQALLEYLYNGLSEKLETKLKKAEKENPHVIDFILNDNNIPQELFMAPIEFYSPGSQEEAYIYVEDAMFFWQDQQELMDYLKARAAQN
ncbi:SEC-C domain-containing protein [Alteribacillus sp. JSM 102045]|uniref:SEC-C domain-containing protein n=1 Tax=Alteribacillus sp. JSM 102045 TaxID=1562101 RepID=UPI0035C1C2A7